MNKEFQKFDLYPFIIIGIDSENSVIYKNYLVSKFYDKIRVGAKITNYTDIDLSTGIKTGYICANKHLVVISEFQDARVLSVLPHTELYDTNGEYYLETMQNALKSEEWCNKNDTAKRQYLRQIIKNSDRAKFFSSFTQLYIKNNTSKSPACDVINLESTLTTVRDIVLNRFEESGFKINFEASGEPLGYKGNKREVLALILNSLCFAIVTSCSKEIFVNIEKESETATFKIFFESKSDITDLYPESEHVITMATGLLVAGKMGVDLNLDKTVKDGKVLYSISYTLNTCKCEEFALSSTDFIVRDIEEYINNGLLFLDLIL